MNKQLLEFLKKRNNVNLNFNFAPSLKKNLSNEKRNIELEKKANSIYEMEMRISCNSPSPIQENFMGNWQEIIDINCFSDFSQRDIFCFPDHDISIKNVLASTTDKSMVIEKSENFYIARVFLNENNPEHFKIIDGLKRGFIKSNSFIFEPLEVEYLEKSKLSPEDAEVVVIHKRGNLISIDPVMFPFYPDNETKILEKNNSEVSTLKNKFLKKEEDLEKDIKDDLEEEDIDESKSKKDKENNEESDAADEAVKADEKEKEVADDVRKEKRAEVSLIVDENGDPDFKESYYRLLESKKTAFDNEKEEDTIKSEPSETSQKLDGEDIDSAKESKRQKQILKNNEEVKKIMSNITNELSPKKFDLKSFERKTLNRNGKNWANRSDIKVEEVKQYFNRLRTIVENENIDEVDFCRSITNCANLPFNANSINELEDYFISEKRSAIDGSAYAQGLAYISIINDPEVKTELERVIPEINGAEFMQIGTLDEVKKDMLIPFSGAANVLAEGADSQEFNGTTVSIVFKPIRYSLELQINPALANQTQTMEKNTIQAKNGISTSIRKSFYTNLVVHKDVMFSTLAAGGYLGGITKDAIVSSVDTSKLTIPDFDNIINSLQAKYGDGIADKFNILMHPNTRTYLFSLLRKEFNAVWVANDSQNTFRDFKIITSSAFPGQVDPVTGAAAAGTIAFILVRKDCIGVRGLNFVSQDNIFINMSKGLMTRFFGTRGEIKLFDPYINTVAVQIGTTTTFSLEKLSLMSEDELVSLNEKLESDKDLRKAQDSKVLKFIQDKVKEISKK